MSNNPSDWGKEKLNPIRFKMNYIVVPIFLAVVGIEMVATCIALEADEAKFLPLAIILFVLIALQNIALLVSTRYVRKKETSIECERYNFDFDRSSDDELTIKCILSDSAFEEVTFSDSGLAYKYSEEGQIYPDGYTEKNQNGSEIHHHELKILYFDYENVTAEVLTGRSNMHVRVFLMLTLKNQNEEYYPKIILDGAAIFAINKYNIEVINKELLDYIVNNKEAAFYQILKYCEIKTIQSDVLSH